MPNEHRYSRREAIRLLAGAGVVAAGLLRSQRTAFADLAQTEAKLSDAQAALDKVDAELAQIASEYEALCIEQDHTLSEIEANSQLINELQEQIEAKQSELEDKQARLSNRVVAAYKSGPTSWLDLLFTARSFEEFTAGVYYMDKISQSERQMIEAVRTTKAELEQKQEELEQHATELEALSARQASQLAEMQANQARVQELFDSLDEEVRELLVQRDAELEAARLEAERAAAERAAAEREAAERAAAAAAAAANTSSSSSSSSSGTSDASSPVSRSGSASAVISSCYYTPSPGAGLCAGWVTNVFSNAGIGWWGGNANDQYASWCTSSNLNELRPGMIIAVSSHPHTPAGRIYGHVGVYVGDGMVMDNIGYIRSCSVDYWISFYGQTVAARWGWFGGVALS